MIGLILLIIACLLFLLSALGVPSSKFNLSALGLFFLTLYFIIGNYKP